MTLATVAVQLLYVYPMVQELFPAQLPVIEVLIVDPEQPFMLELLTV